MRFARESRLCEAERNNEPFLAASRAAGRVRAINDHDTAACECL
jgi:hypothetical protein